MKDQTDSQLLCAYAECRSEAAFAELVRRHLDLVYSAAKRMVCDSHLAEDVTQRAFVALARNATQLADRPVLSGWLHRTTQNIAAQTVRADVRRRIREQEAAAMNELLAPESDASWAPIAPQLDAALGELAEPDRDAILLRYFEKKSAQEMAGILGISDDAAQKRVSRAVERLREFFTKRGVTVGAGGLVVLISANAVQSAPVGLAATISATALLTGTAVQTSTFVAATKAIAMTALQKTVITAALAVVAGAGIYEARQAAQLREQNQTLQRQLSPLAGQIEHLQSERDEATNRMADLLAENARLKSNPNQNELLKLRGEVGQLRRQVAEREPRPVASTSTATAAALAPTTEAEFETAKRQMSFAMERVQTALRQFVTNNPYGVLIGTNGQLNPELFANFPGLPLDNLEIKARDVQGLANALDQKSRLILAASKEPIFYNGMWTRFYLLADGTIRGDTSYNSFQQFRVEYPSDEDLDALREAASRGGRVPENLRNIMTTMDPVMKAYSAANNGNMPNDPAQLAPYATTPEQQAALQQVLQMKQSAQNARFKIPAQ